jgi:hypothetical protein
MKPCELGALEEAQMVSLGSGHDHRDESAHRGEEDHMTEEIMSGLN